MSLPWQLFSEVNISKWCLTILCMYNLFGVERMVVSNETQGNTTKCIVFKYSAPIFKVTRKPWSCATAVPLWNYMPHEFLNCVVLSVKDRNNIFKEIVANVQHHFILFGKAFWRTSELLVSITGRQVPIYSYFFLFFSAYSYFSYFFSNFLLFFLFFNHFTYNKQIFVRDLNILSLFKYVVYRVH